MTTEEQDAVIGRLMREKRDAESMRVAIEAEAHRIGTQLGLLGTAAKANLAGIQKEGDGLEADYFAHPSWVNQKVIDAPTELLKLASEYRDVLETIKRITRQLTQAGWS